MANHVRNRILYPPPGDPHHVPPPSIVASSSGANPASRRRRRSIGLYDGGLGAWFAPRTSEGVRNPPSFFDEDPELDVPARSGFVGDNILEGFDLNTAPEGEDHNHFDCRDTTPNGFGDGPHSANTGSVSNAVEEAGEEITSQPVEPFVGMIFDDIEEARKVYNDYAMKMGFGTRIGNTKYIQARNAPPDTILSRVFECVHTGRPPSEKKKAGSNGGSKLPVEEDNDMSIHSAQKSRSKQASEQVEMSDTRQRMKVIRHDCKAHMVVGVRNGAWIVTVFRADHTHTLVKQVGRRRFYRSHSKVPEEDYQFIQTLHNQNITTSQLMGALGSVHGGDPRCLGYVKRDVSNIRTMLRNEVTLRDMEMTLEYFKQRQDENSNFFYATQVDKDGAVRALFWVDGRTRSLYHKYKDCVFFDTTFCTNRYNMPFAPIVGINNHSHTIVLGCALLADEKIETFKWVFEQWMLAMDGVHPDNIMTDQDQAMAEAIRQVFPNSVHRCCLYHILHLARKKLGPNLAEGNPFSDAFYGCIYGTDTVKQFEDCWEHMLNEFGMTENTHLQNMWKSRTTWAPVYFRKRFFPFTSTTGRSEGLNSYFKTLIRPGDSVYNFVQQYELCQILMLDREDNAGFAMETTRRSLWGSYAIEKQGQEFYTTEIFERYQKHVAASTKFYPVRADVEGICFDLVPNPGLDVRTYRVQVEFEEGL